MELNKENILLELRTLADEGRKVVATSDSYSFIDHARFDSWRAKILTVLNWSRLNLDEYVEQIRNSQNNKKRCAEAIIVTLNDIADQVDRGIISASATETFDSVTELDNIFDRFHTVARQLRTRYSERSTLIINDEYDVQDLLHALLLLHFKDVRAEEWTPSYAGGCVRMDFLLKDIQTVIEVKKTRDSMNSKTLGEELIVDIEKYQSHPDCKTLYCFVYDPAGILGNPAGIKSDLEAAHSGFVTVYIKPD